MGFQDQVGNIGAGGGSGFSMFKEGVKVTWMGGKTLGANGIVNFRILPAHNPADVLADGSVNPYGWLPSRTPTGEMTDWGFMIDTCRFVGHKNNQMDFLSPVGIDPGRPFLLDNIYSTCASNEDWNYLVAREKGSKTPPVLARPQQVLMMNVLLVDGGLQGVTLAGFTRRSIDALLAPGSGLLNQTVEVDAEDIQKDYMRQWRVRDITSPTDGYVITLQKAVDNTFTAVPQQINGAARKLPLDSSLLPARYPLYAWQSIVNLKTQEQVVQDLIRVFNQRNAKGIHEHYMLKEALEPMGFNIPTPAAAPAVSATVPGGFEKPASVPGSYNPPAAPTTAPGVYLPPPPVAAAPSQPAYVAPTAAPTAAPAATPTATPAQPAAPTAAPAAAPVVPGDPVAPSGADQAWMKDFLQDIKG